MVKVRGKKKWYDEQADWVPAKGRPFVMKGTMQEEEPPKEARPKEEPPGQEPRIKTDAEGMEEGLRSRRRIRRG